ncbi:hypothetical protein PIB30_067506 [Stylosanthes scabra]|uniref:Uncharacterized protein n=1 Tax=Stylosanthes scabra TaxID=79078 RepID=A0ABU6TP80_9FABA|nr:hypothetical protein [Stylosanthes scabra]
MREGWLCLWFKGLNINKHVFIVGPQDIDSTVANGASAVNKNGSVTSPDFGGSDEVLRQGNLAMERLSIAELYLDLNSVLSVFVGCADDEKNQRRE